MISTQTILSEVKSLPTLSAAFVRFSELINDERSNAKDFQEAAKLDPSLTANLLRVANSPYFGSPREVNSVQQAVTLMGMKRVYEVATSVAFLRVIPSVLPGYKIVAHHFWRHSIAVAIIAERLAIEVGLKIPELTFTAGILHDIGKLAIGTFLSEESNAVVARLRQNQDTLVVAEAEVLGLDHAEVGGAVADQWRLPAPVCSVVRWHHEPNRSEDHRTLVDLVHAADGLAHTFGYGADIGELSRSIIRDSTERLKITVLQLERVASDTLEKIQELSATIKPSKGVK